MIEGYATLPGWIIFEEGSLRCPVPVMNQPGLANDVQTGVVNLPLTHVCRQASMDSTHMAHLLKPTSCIDKGKAVSDDAQKMPRIIQTQIAFR